MAPAPAAEGAWPIEYKTDKGKLREEQKKFLLAFAESSTDRYDLIGEVAKASVDILDHTRDGVARYLLK